MGVDGYDTFGYIHAVELIWGWTLSNFTWLLCLKYVFFFFFFLIRGKWNKLLGQPFRTWRRMGQLLLPILNQISQRRSLPICIKKMDLRVVMSSWLEQILWVTEQALKHCTLILVGLRFHKLVNLLVSSDMLLLWLLSLTDAIEY